MTRIGVLSDTHITRPNQHLPDQLLEDFKNVDLIMHAGDWVDLCLMDQLSPLAEVIGVYGNMDGPSVRYELPEVQHLNLDGYKIRMQHGWGPRASLASRILRKCHEQPDLLIYGHSHAPEYAKEGDVYLFNPGSPTTKCYQGKGTYGIITLGKDIEAAIIQVE